jgi:NAD(P)-dependent dehydrogenase (short-subunit alcohol dehydrogenase family)
MDSLLDFTEKSVLITGAARGFGKMLAEELALRGARLLLSDINEDGVQGVAQSLREQGSEVRAMRCNVAEEKDCKAIVDAAVASYGRLDIAVNNAGIAPAFMPFHAVDEQTMDSQWSVNVKGVQFGMKHQLGQMTEQGCGIILNVSSMAGLLGAPKNATYSAAKHAVIGLTKSAAVEYGRHDIRINAICPFFSLTDMVTKSSLAIHSDLEEVTKSLGNSTPMRRLAEPREIVNVMLLVLSPANTYMTGQSIAVDGGASAI